MIALLPILFFAATGPVQEDALQEQEKEGITLHEPTSGATLTLPPDWAFAEGDEGLIARSENGRGMVLLAGAEEDFERLRADVRALVLAHLDDLVVAKTTVVGIDERGAIEEIVQVNGKGTSKRDGQPVEFAAQLVKSGESGVLALGAWKDEKHAKVVADILTGLHIEHTAAEAGLEITNAATGVRIKIPAGWRVVRSRKGLLTTCPHGSGMAILMNWQKDFEESITTMRSVLLGWVFKEVQIGEFAVVEASYHESLARVVAASGTAVDRVDGKPASFRVLRIQRPDADEGAALFGAWKDEKHAEEVAQLMRSVQITKKKEKEEEK